MPRRKALPLILALTVVLSGSLDSADRDGPRPALPPQQVREVLESYVGHWKGHGSESQSSGVQERSNTEAGARLVLGGKFVEARSIDTGGASELVIIGFDESSRCFRLRGFSSKRAWLDALGEWDAETSTMKWSGTLNGELHFAAEEKHELERMRAEWRVSDRRGRSLALGSSDDRRLSPSAPERLFEKALHTVDDSHVRELQSLHDFVGPWRETLEVELPGRDAISGAGTYVASWVLGGAAQLWRGRRETSLGSEEYLWVFAFDEAKQEHRAWWFSGGGVSVEYVGGRKAGSSEWRWHASGLAADVQQSLTVNAVDARRVESTLLTRGESGRGITLRATATRDRAPAN